MKLIHLTRGQSAKVDDQDFERFNSLRWRAIKKKSGFYAMHTGPRPQMETLYLHREIMGNPVGKTVDHENHDTLDCRRSNLRVCSKSQNGANLKGPYSNSKSGIRGVYWNKQCAKWRATIRINGKTRCLGLFHDINLASEAFKSAAIANFGEFAGSL